MDIVGWARLLVFHFLNLHSAAFSLTLANERLSEASLQLTLMRVWQPLRDLWILCVIYISTTKSTLNKILTNLTYKSYLNSKLQQAFHFIM